MKTIKMSNCEEFAVVDDEDFEALVAYKWHKLPSGYVVKYQGRKTVYMHRLIFLSAENATIDHVNRNKLDNRRSNLRIASISENNANKPKQANNTTGFKGVVRHRKKFRATIQVRKKFVSLGVFQSAEEAARAYDNAAKEFFGEFAFLNFEK